MAKILGVRSKVLNKNQLEQFANIVDKLQNTGYEPLTIMNILTTTYKYDVVMGLEDEEDEEKAKYLVRKLGSGRCKKVSENLELVITAL